MKPIGYPWSGQKFTGDQLVLMVQAILNACMDRIESALPQSNEKKERVYWLEYASTGKFSSWVLSAEETAGMALACLYASITNDGMGIVDALELSAMSSAIDKYIAPYHKALASGRLPPKRRNLGIHPRIEHEAHRFVAGCFANYWSEPPTQQLRAKRRSK